MRALEDQAGITVPLTMIVMTLAGFLAGIVLVASQATSGAADDERRGKRALAAAEAGLQEAAYRLTVLRPSPTMCLSGSGTYAAAPGTPTGTPPGECAAVTGQNATGDAYAYHVTPQLPAGTSCAGVTMALDPLATDHCVTSAGTARGLTRRVQARVRVQRRTIFGNLGVVGLTGVTMLNSDKVYSDIGSNGGVTGTNSVEIFGNIQLSPTAPAPSISGSNPPVVRRADPWDLPQVDFEASQATNDNANLTSWGTSRYIAAERRVALNNSVEYTLAAGTYNLCEFYADNSVKIKIAAGARVVMFIDSPARDGSNCPSTTGRFCLDNSVEFNKDNSPSDASRLEIYVYGSPNFCSAGLPGLPFDGTNITALPAHSPVVINNSVQFYGTIYAPTTRVILTNSITFEGGIASNNVAMGNSVIFRYPASVRNQNPAIHGVRRMAWIECRRNRTVATDPESGCP